MNKMEISITQLAEIWIKDKHDDPVFEEHESGRTLVIVKCYGPLDIEQFCNFGIAVGTYYPESKIVGPDAFADYTIRILI